MRASMTPNVLARSPKTHSNPTINRLLSRRNRALLLQQQTTAMLRRLSNQRPASCAVSGRVALRRPTRKAFLPCFPSRPTLETTPPQAGPWPEYAPAFGALGGRPLEFPAPPARTNFPAFLAIPVSPGLRRRPCRRPPNGQAPQPRMLALASSWPTRPWSQSAPLRERRPPPAERGHLPTPWAGKEPGR